MKHSTKVKIICLVMSILLVLQVFPMSVIAIDNNETLAPSTSESYEDLEVVCEIKENRSEFSKEFLLEDGTFYKITALSPIHNLINEEWVDITDSFDTVNTVEDVGHAMSLLNENSTEITTFDEDQELEYNEDFISDADVSIDYLYNSGACFITDYDAYEIFPNDGAIKVTPTDIEPYTAKNKVINSAKLTFERAEVDNPSATQIIVYEGAENVTVSNISYQRVLDSFCTDSIDEYTVDITYLYQKWDLDKADKKGIIIRAQGEDYFTITNVYFEVRYENVGWNDSKYTYKTIDMGDAGLFYINDYTNTTLLENRVFKLDSKVLPVYVSRINDSANLVTDCSAGFGFNWNIESKISVTDNLGIWTTVNLEKKYFAPDEPVITDNGYQIWKEVSTAQIEDQTSIYFYIPNEDVTSENIDYSEVIIKQGDTVYNFDNMGRLIQVTRPGLNNTPMSVNISYNSSNELVLIKDENNIEYHFSYAMNNQIRRKCLQYIDINGSRFISFDISRVINYADERYSTYLMQSFSYMENGEPIEHQTVNYSFDLLGNILDIVGIENNVWSLYYTNTDRNRAGNSGNRLDYYLMTTEENNNNLSSELKVSFEAPNGNYREIKELDLQTNNETSEIIQYDNKHRIITHKEPNGHCICAEYDDFGVIKSFAYDESAQNRLNNGSFESQENNIIWTYQNCASIVDSTYPEEMHGTKELKITLNSEDTAVVSQTVNMNFLPDKTYVVGAWVKVEGTIPDINRKVGVQVMNASNLNNPTEVAFGTIDNGLDGEWQYRLQAFKLSNNCSRIQINLAALAQCGEIRFDEITLFEAIESQADLNGVNISSPISYTYNESNLLQSEGITNGIHSLNKYYNYYNNEKISEMIDTNGVSEYYSYSTSSGASITSKGYTKDENGNIIDATNYQYNALGLLTSITQTVNGLYGENGTISDVMSSGYTWLNGDIKSVTHNGSIYNFEYSNDRPNEISVTANNHTYDLITYSYENCMDSINYANNFTVEYSYDIYGKIEFVDCYYPSDSFDPIYTYTYCYNNDELTAVSCGTDDEEYYTINYEDSGYSIDIYDCEMYIKNNNTNGNITENVKQSNYNGSNNSEWDTFTTYPTTVSIPNSYNGNITNSSEISVRKNAIENKVSEMTYERSSVTDYFNRIINKKTALEYKPNTLNNTVYNVESNTNYNYKLLDVGVTSDLVYTYENFISTDYGTGSESDLTVCATYSRKYEYDDRGNLKYGFVVNYGVEIPCEYYEYDEANQVVISVDFTKGIVNGYIYDVGGNIRVKNVYDYESLGFNVAERKITELNAPVLTIPYSYDSTFKDRLISYNNETIPYDELGNPTYYIGKDIDNVTVEGTLTWNGYQLSKFENSRTKIEYLYNQNGYRTMKTVYNMPGETLAYRVSYIWDGNVLKHLIFKIGTNDEVSLNIIYDQDGNPSGYITSTGIPYYFLKDINENVVGIIHPDGSKLCSISYDTWGNPSYTYYGNLLAQMVAKATVVFNPVTYHGYIYDYETGMYCSNGRFYSPMWGRYINSDNPSALADGTDNFLDANLYLFCNNNPVNNIDVCALWSRDYFSVETNRRGLKVEMNELFSSRAFCTVFANEFLEKYGQWSPDTGYVYQNMDSLRIASNLFACYVAKNAPAAINKVNASWGDGWMQNCQLYDEITVNRVDTNAWKYKKIWYAAKDIKTYAWSEGIYITI